jgi:hypothetical protein
MYPNVWQKGRVKQKLGQKRALGAFVATKTGIK